MSAFKALAASNASASASASGSSPEATRKRRSTITAATGDPNQGLWPAAARGLSSTDPNEFRKTATHISNFCLKDQAYYDAARLKIVQFLDLARATVGEVHGLKKTEPYKFAVHNNTGSAPAISVGEPYRKLVATVGQHHRHFVEPELETRLREHVKAILSTDQLKRWKTARQSDNKPWPPALTFMLSSIAPITSASKPRSFNKPVLSGPKPAKASSSRSHQRASTGTAIIPGAARSSSPDLMILDTPPDGVFFNRQRSSSSSGFALTSWPGGKVKQEPQVIDLTELDSPDSPTASSPLPLPEITVVKTQPVSPPLLTATVPTTTTNELDSLSTRLRSVSVTPGPTPPKAFLSIHTSSLRKPGPLSLAFSANGSPGPVRGSARLRSESPATPLERRQSIQEDDDLAVIDMKLDELPLGRSKVKGKGKAKELDPPMMISMRTLSIEPPYVSSTNTAMDIVPETPVDTPNQLTLRVPGPSVPVPNPDTSTAKQASRAKQVKSKETRPSTPPSPNEIPETPITTLSLPPASAPVASHPTPAGVVLFNPSPAHPPPQAPGLHLSLSGANIVPTPGPPILKAPATLPSSSDKPCTGDLTSTPPELNPAVWVPREPIATPKEPVVINAPWPMPSPVPLVAASSPHIIDSTAALSSSSSSSKPVTNMAPSMTPPATSPTEFRAMSYPPWATFEVPRSPSLGPIRPAIWIPSTSAPYAIPSASSASAAPAQVPAKKKKKKVKEKKKKNWMDADMEEFMSRKEHQKTAETTEVPVADSTGTTIALEPGAANALEQTIALATEGTSTATVAKSSEEIATALPPGEAQALSPTHVQMGDKAPTPGPSKLPDDEPIALILARKERRPITFVADPSKIVTPEPTKIDTQLLERSTPKVTASAPMIQDNDSATWEGEDLASLLGHVTASFMLSPSPAPEMPDAEKERLIRSKYNISDEVQPFSLENLPDGQMGHAGWPGHSFMLMMVAAVWGSPDKALTTKAFVQAIKTRYPFYNAPNEFRKLKQNVYNNISQNFIKAGGMAKGRYRYGIDYAKLGTTKKGRKAGYSTRAMAETSSPATPTDHPANHDPALTTPIVSSSRITLEAQQSQSAEALVKQAIAPMSSSRGRLPLSPPSERASPASLPPLPEDATMEDIEDGEISSHEGSPPRYLMEDHIPPPWVDAARTPPVQLTGTSLQPLEFADSMEEGEVPDYIETQSVASSRPSPEPTNDKQKRRASVSPDFSPQRKRTKLTTPETSPTNAIYVLPSSEVTITEPIVATASSSDSGIAGLRESPMNEEIPSLSSDAATFGQRPSLGINMNPGTSSVPDPVPISGISIISKTRPKQPVDITEFWPKSNPAARRGRFHIEEDPFADIEIITCDELFETFKDLPFLQKPPS